MLSALILAVCAFADSGIIYDRPNEQTCEKVLTALKNDQCNLYYDFYNADASTKPVDSEVTGFDCIASINGNLYIEYSIKNEFEIDYELRLGGCYLFAKGRGYAVYQPQEDKLISLDSAYTSGIISESDLEEILKHYNNERRAGNTDKNLGSIIGDYNGDSVIDVIDLTVLRDAVVNSKYYTIIMDMNKDKAIDIQDVVIMRSIIVNGR